MFSPKKEALKLERKDVSVAKYLKPEVRAEVQAEEEKLAQLKKQMKITKRLENK